MHTNQRNYSIKRKTTKQEKENYFVINLSLKKKKQCFTKIDDAK
jgi:hypothetical protein